MYEQSIEDVDAVGYDVSVELTEAARGRERIVVDARETFVATRALRELALDYTGEAPHRVALVLSSGTERALVARSEGKLKTLAKELTQKHGVTVRVQSADLSTAGAVEHLYAAVRHQHTVVDVLVNCAGVLEQGAFAVVGGHGVGFRQRSVRGAAHRCSNAMQFACRHLHPYPYRGARRRKVGRAGILKEIGL